MMLKDFTKNLSVAGLVAWFFTLVVPLQSYLGNADQLAIDFSGLAGELVVCFFIVLVSLCGLLMLMRGRIGSAARIVLVALVFIGYLETGVLAFGCPPLDGGTEYYENGLRGILDASVLLVALGVVICLRAHWKTIAFALFILSIASLLDTGHRSTSAVSAASGQALTSNASVVKSSFYSSHRNVLLYVLDCLTTPHAVRVLEQDPELAKAFEGFICFTNSIGMADCTVSGVAGITTGRYLERPDQESVYAATCFSSNSFLQAYAAAGVPVFFRPGSFTFGTVANAPVVEALEEEEKTSDLELCRRVQDQQRWNLLEIVGFRLTPFAVKAVIYRHFAKGWAECFQSGSLAYLSFSERWVYPILAQASLRDDVSQTLQFWHTEGSHPPLGVNRYGERDGVPRSFYEQRVEKTWYVLSELAKLFRVLKQRGVYDRAFIVLLADHGREPLTEGADTPDVIPARAQSVLWVKPLNAKGALTYSDVSVSQQRVANLIREARTQDLDSVSVRDLLCEEKRLYRAVEGDDLIDHIIDKSGRVDVIRHKAEIRLEDLSAIDLNRRYRLTGHGVDAPFPAWFGHTRFYDGGGPRMVIDGVEARIAFRVPQGCSSCEVMLAFDIWPNGREVEMKLADGATGAPLYRAEGPNLRRRIKFVLSADATGLASFVILSQQEVALQWIKVNAVRK